MNGAVDEKEINIENMIENIEKAELIKTIDSIKQDVINTRNKIMYSANRELINMYFRIGKNISENSKYGSNFVTILSKTLKLDFPDSTGFSERNLWRMKSFYEQYKDFSILPPAVAELPWTHNYILLETEFKPEYIGQLGFYVTAVDKTLKKEQDNQTIGLLPCKEKDKLSVEWALDFINVPIGVASYNVINKTQKDILDKLPTEQDINMYIAINNE